MYVKNVENNFFCNVIYFIFSFEMIDEVEIYTEWDVLLSDT